MGNTKEELIINNKQKNELESKFLKDIEMFVLYSCYKTNDLNSNDLLLNNKITEVFNKKNYIFNYNDYQNNNRLCFSKYMDIINKPKILSIVKNICKEINLTICNIEDINKYKQGTYFPIFEPILANFGDSFFKEQINTLNNSQFGLILINNIDYEKWNDVKLEQYQELLNSIRENHNSSFWPILALENNNDNSLNYHTKLHLNKRSINDLITTSLFKEKNTIIELNFLQKLILKVKTFFGINKENSTPVLKQDQTKEEIDNFKNIQDIAIYIRKFNYEKAIYLPKSINNVLNEIQNNISTFNYKEDDLNKILSTEDFYNLKTMVKITIPKLIKEYLSIPSNLVNTEVNRDGKTAIQLTLETLHILNNNTSSLISNLNQNKLNELNILNRVAEQKFGMLSNTDKININNDINTLNNNDKLENSVRNDFLIEPINIKISSIRDNNDNEVIDLKIKENSKKLRI